jgi:hypothetical protein
VALAGCAAGVDAEVVREVDDLLGLSDTVFGTETLIALTKTADRTARTMALRDWYA